MTNKDNCKFRLPAEWEPNEYVMLSWPHEGTDWAYMLDDVTRCYIEISKAIMKYARLIIVAPDVSLAANALKGFVDTTKVVFVEIPTNDTWARDFGMLCTVGENGSIRINDFKFNGWGLKFAACEDNLITGRMMAKGLKNDNAEYVNRLNFVLEGGSIDVNGEGTLMTTSNCLLSPNRNGASTKEEIECVLKDAFGCSRLLWVEHGDLEGDDTDSHIDTLARFLPGNVIAYSACDRPDDSHYGELKRMEEDIAGFRTPEGSAYATVALPIPEAIYDEAGERLPATYANFLLINGAVILPVYGDTRYDRIAVDKIKAALPGYDVITVDCRALIRQHGSLHCVTMQVPKGALKEC
ncbi:MAG: agmatine deiminase family protein [Muribaculaceae bacterium]|nr:agmatine deiminase family protein [Muribaculaceae bacterium]